MTDVDFLEPAAEEQILATHQIVLSRAAGETGVINGNRITPTSPASMSIDIGAGRIKISNTPDDVDAETKLIAVSNATLGRIDIIIRNTSGAVQVVAGSFAAVNDPKGLGNWHQYDSPAPAGNIPAGAILGAIYVAPAATAISAGDIWMFAGPVGESAHTQNTDQYLDYGGASQVSAAQARAAASAVHAQGTDQGLDTGGPNAVTAANVKDAVAKKHAQGTDQGLDAGGPNAVTAAQVAAAVLNRSYAMEFGLVGSPATVPLGYHAGQEVPLAGTITAARLMSCDGTSGSITVKVYKGTYANSPASMTLVATYTIATSTKSETTGLSIAVAKGDWIVPYVDTATSLKNVTLSLTVSL